MKWTRMEWWFPKLLCLIAACALWVYVMNEQNPMMENTYTVPVETRNLDRSLVATNVPDSVKVKIRMPRSDMVYMRSDNIKAYVDLSGMTDGDYPNTPILVSVPSDETVISVSPQHFNLNVDTYAVKTLPAKVQAFGTPETNFSLDSTKVTPDTITIAGSSSKIAQADRAVVSVNLAGKEKDFTVEAAALDGVHRAADVYGGIHEVHKMAAVNGSVLCMEIHIGDIVFRQREIRVAADGDPVLHIMGV